MLPWMSEDREAPVEWITPTIYGERILLKKHHQIDIRNNILKIQTLKFENKKVE